MRKYSAHFWGKCARTYHFKHIYFRNDFVEGKGDMNRQMGRRDLQAWWVDCINANQQCRCRRKVFGAILLPRVEIWTKDIGIHGRKEPILLTVNHLGRHERTEKACVNASQKTLMCMHALHNDIAKLPSTNVHYSYMLIKKKFNFRCRKIQICTMNSYQHVKIM